MQNVTRALGAITLLAAASQAAAQSPDDAAVSAGEIVEEIVVTGTRVAGQPFSVTERVSSLCGAEVRGRTFTGDPTQAFNALRAFGQSNPGQPTAIVLTAAELTALANAELQKQADAGQQIPASNVAVTIDRDGQLQSQGFTLAAADLSAFARVESRP